MNSATNKTIEKSATKFQELEQNSSPLRRGRPNQSEHKLLGKILNATTQLILSQGYAATTMDAVAKEAGVSKKTLYRFASNREDLLGCVVRQWTDIFVVTTQADAENITRFSTMLEKMLFSIAQHVLAFEAVGMFRLLISDIPARTQILEKYNLNGIKRSQDMLAQWLERQKNKGIIRQDLDSVKASDLLLSMVIAEPLRQVAIGLEEPLPAWDITPRISAAISLVRWE